MHILCLRVLLASPSRPPFRPRLAVRLSPLRGVMPWGAACGSALLVGPLSLLRVLRPLFHARLCACCTCSGAVGRAFPTATVVLHSDRIADGVDRIGYFFASALLFRGASTGAAGRVFPAATAYEHTVFSWNAFQVVCFFFPDPVTFYVASQAVFTALSFLILCAQFKTGITGG